MKIVLLGGVNFLHQRPTVRQHKAAFLTLQSCSQKLAGRAVESDYTERDTPAVQSG